MTKKEQILQEIKNLEKKMYFNEIADDMYYTNGRRDEDLKQIGILKNELAKEQEDENVC